MRHIVDFRNTSDTGETDAAAIIPYNDGEAANQTTLRRPVENARTRTEVLRALMREHLMLRDVERNGVLLSGGGLITFNGTVAGGGGGDGKFTLGSSLFVVPRLTPGDGVGTTAPYVASTPSVLKVGTAGNNQVIITSVLKQFEGSDLAKGDVNRISVEILNDSAESIALEGASGDVNNVKIHIISGTTTAENLVDLINNDVTVTQFVTAALEGTSTGTNNADLWGPAEWGSDYSQRFLSGGFPGVIHEINTGNLASFFSAHAENPLQKGDTLAISYDTVMEDGGVGGALQSTPENGNTLIGAGSLFNTRREPEKSINAIPICKCIDDDTVVFSDGAYIVKGAPARLIFDSGSALNAAAYGIIDTTGWTRLDTAPGAHVPPGNIQEALNNTDDIFDSVMTEVETARSSSIFGAKASLDARIEAVDTHAATVVTVGPTGSGRMYTGPTGLYDAMVARNGTPTLIVVDLDAVNYTFSSNLTITGAPMVVIGKSTGREGSDYVRVHLDTYVLTFDAAGSGFQNVAFFKNATPSPQLVFEAGAKDCFLRGCYVTCDVEVKLDADLFKAENCEFRSARYIDAAEDTLVSDSYFAHSTAGAVAVVDVSLTTFTGCWFNLYESNYLSFSAGHVRDCVVNAEMTAASLYAAVSVSAGGSIDGLKITKDNSSPTLQKVLRVHSVTARNVHIDLNNTEVRYSSGSGDYIASVLSSSDGNGHLIDFSIRNFKLPFDTVTLSNDQPLVSLYPIGVSYSAFARHGFIGGISHDAASGNMDVTLVGSAASGLGAAVVDNVTIDTTGITYVTGNKLGIYTQTGARSSVVKNCRILGNGFLDKFITGHNDVLRIEDNTIDLVGVGTDPMSAIAIPPGSVRVAVRRNIVGCTGTMNGNVISINGVDASDCSHNQVFYDGGSPGGSAAIALTSVSSGVVIGNTIGSVFTSKITYNSITPGNLVPLVANLGDLNYIA